MNPRDDERRKFEALARSEHLNTNINYGGRMYAAWFSDLPWSVKYWSERTQLAWMTWLARAEQAETPRAAEQEGKIMTPTMEQGDGAGCDVSLESANKAVKALAELWGHALFDAGPQDYDFMQQEILATFDKEKVLRNKLSAIVRWLEANQEDVFRHGLWDAINAAAAPVEDRPAPTPECFHYKARFDAVSAKECLDCGATYSEGSWHLKDGAPEKE